MEETKEVNLQDIVVDEVTRRFLELAKPVIRSFLYPPPPPTFMSTTPMSRYQCFICGKVFKTGQGLGGHRRMVHGVGKGS